MVADVAALANIAGAKIDAAIITAASKRKMQLVYTRYADDISISTDVEEDIPAIMSIVRSAVSRCGHKLNESKTSIEHARGGARHVTGIAVYAGDIRPTRDARRTLRAMRFKARVEKNEERREALLMRAAGYAEWCALRAPRARATNMVVASAGAAGDV